MENLKNGLENLRMEEKNKITDLIEGTLKEEDYELRINFLIGGMMCEESNDSPEKIRKNQEWLSEIAKFCKVYTGDKKSSQKGLISQGEHRLSKTVVCV